MSSISQPYYLKLNSLDKFFHFGAYALLSVILYFVLVNQDKVSLLKIYPVFFTFLFATSFGILNELHQLFIPYRTFNKLDIFANTLGTFAAVMTIKFGTLILKFVKIN